MRHFWIRVPVLIVKFSALGTCQPGEGFAIRMILKKYGARVSYVRGRRVKHSPAFVFVRHVDQDRIFVRSMQHPIHHPNPDNEAVAALEMEIAELERALDEAEVRVNTFERHIRAALHAQIVRLQELTTLYKKLKADKKEKRRAQKKKGKNFQEQTGIVKSKRPSPHNLPTTADPEQLKRLYKEAIVHVHPDKFAQNDPALSDRATAMTAHLNALYDAGDLMELSALHRHILSGNAMAHVPYQPQTLVDPVAMVRYLQHQRDELQQALHDIRAMQLFDVLETYPDPMTFIGELRLQFEERIQVFAKRTRKA